jgi:hypothetical protein
MTSDSLELEFQTVVNCHVGAGNGARFPRRGQCWAISRCCLTDAHIVEWSPSGGKYIVVVQNKVDVYRLGTASVSGTITNGKRISSVTFLSVSSGQQGWEF